MRDLTVVIPAYNEEKSIKGTIEKIWQYCPESPIIVVNDASHDKTGKIANELGVRVIAHPENRGYGEALKTGINGAKTDFVCFLDADMTYHPKYLPILYRLAKEEGYDIVWGNRFGGSFNRMPKVRKFGNRIISLFFFIVTRKRVRDCSSGERLIRKSAVPRINLEALPPDLDFITGLTKTVVKRGLKYKEIPINYEMREGQSKLNIFSHGYKMMKNIVKY